MDQSHARLLGIVAAVLEFLIRARITIRHLQRRVTDSELLQIARDATLAQNRDTPMPEGVIDLAPAWNAELL